MLPKPESEPLMNRSASLWYLILIGLSVALGVQALRVFITTLSYDLGSKYGQTTGVVPAFLTFLSPFLCPLITRLVNPRRALFAALGGLATVRLLMQVSHSADVNMILSGVAFALTLIGLTLGISLARRGNDAGGLRFARGLFLGMTIESALHSAFLTWDYAWQPGVVPLLTAVAVSGLALLALWKLRSDFRDRQLRDVTLNNGLSLIALGPFFMLQLLFFQDVGFIASSSSASLEVAIAVVLVGNAIGFVALNTASRRLVRLIAGVALVAVAVLLPITSGASIIVLALVGQAAAALVLPSVLSAFPSEQAPSSVWRTSVVIGLAGVLFAILGFLYYVSTLVTLPFSYTILPATGAIIILFAAFVQPPDVDLPDRRLV
ncbi:MAG TPA: hypothetical protein VMT34_04075, partial [Aggregatilineales bacterium]|nr:hypothetical protein [Aggregatilineales bacterium]